MWDHLLGCLGLRQQAWPELLGCLPLPRQGSYPHFPRRKLDRAGPLQSRPGPESECGPGLSERHGPGQPAAHPAPHSSAVRPGFTTQLAISGLEVPGEPWLLGEPPGSRPSSPRPLRQSCWPPPPGASDSTYPKRHLAARPVLGCPSLGLRLPLRAPCVPPSPQLFPSPRLSLCLSPRPAASHGEGPGPGQERQVCGVPLS